MSVRSFLGSAAGRLVAAAGVRPRLMHRSTFLASASDRANSRIPDYYATLGISRTASPHDIKLAYFRTAKKYHPDTNKNSQARFMFEFAAEAYEVLSDPESREEYDRFGEVRTRTGGTTSQGPRIQRDAESADSEKLFSKLFGQEGHRLADEYQFAGEYNDDTYSGSDASTERIVCVSFDDAAMGCRMPIWVNIIVICPKCDGDGSEMGYQANICPYCEGTGFETERLGGMITRKSCSYCNGTKMFIRFKCHECRGSGKTVRTFEQYVDIPSGCEDGQILRADIHPEILKWTLDHHDHFWIKVSVEEHPTLTKDGSDIHSEADISISQALLGGELFCKGLNESTVILNIDPGSLETSHSTLVAPEEGIPLATGASVRGNHYVTVGIRVPKRLSQSNRQKFIQFFEGCGIPPNGIVDGCGPEPDHAHKLRVGVVEPDSVHRSFGRARKSMKEKLQADDNLKTQWLDETLKRYYERYKEFTKS